MWEVPVVENVDSGASGCGQLQSIEDVKAEVIAVVIGKVHSSAGRKTAGKGVERLLGVAKSPAVVMSNHKMKISMKGSCLGGWIGWWWLVGTGKWLKQQRQWWNTDEQKPAPVVVRVMDS